MNVMLICQCDKKALVQSRRILDQFAERRGERTWQTPITQAGLDTLRRLLKKSARRNTAVACHWIRGLDHSELLWIVGDAKRFNEQGAVPTHTTTRNVLRKDDENDWHCAEDISLLTQMAALLHDLGKASIAFQNKLRLRSVERNLYRHEWVSLRLFLAFVGSDDDPSWLRRLAAPTDADDNSWLAAGRYQRDGLDAATPPPFKQLAPLAAAIAWLVVSHHRLPTLPSWDESNKGEQQWLGKKSARFNPSMLDNLIEGITHEWNECSRPASLEDVEVFWQFEHGLPVTWPKWRAQAAKIANRLLTLQAKPGHGDWLNNPYVMHLARMSLMLSDHYYSSLPPESGQRVKGDGLHPLFANTHIDGQLKQPLDEHLLGVARMARSVVHGLPGFERHLPRLARHPGLRKRAGAPRFSWQDKAADAATSMRAGAQQHGAFIVNMASTGCGKTLANARIMYALADPQIGMRCTFALGLRTLTLQTGHSYREDLNLGEDDLAIRVGGSASRALFDYYQAEAEACGSASTQALIEEDSHVRYEGAMEAHGLLSKVMNNPQITALLNAPMLVCTIDHLMPATEAQRAGRQIAPMLRLLSSDLVLDELDDFDLADLPALTRLVYWAGLLGTRVLLSSATLPPALLEGMFQAYGAGRLHYRRNRGEPGTSVSDIPCLWVDEFGAHKGACNSAESFVQQHSVFVGRRVQALEGVEPRRRGELIPLKIDAQPVEVMRRVFAQHVQAAMLQAHARHAEACPHSGKKISVGVVRMANIEPLFDVAQALFALGAPVGQRIHLCVYHSRFPLLLRSAIEAQLDSCLNRREPNALYAHPQIRQLIDQYPEQDQLFVVLGSPVTEVGRDHDYDWAVVEPSSMRSLIQLAGRVQRHRDRPCQSANVLVFDSNLRHFEEPGAAAFIRPGFESESGQGEHPWRLASHRLAQLLDQADYQCISARPRIQPGTTETWRPRHNLVDLEHARISTQMLPKDRSGLGKPTPRGVKPAAFELDAACAWQYPHAALTWVLPQQQPFRESSLREIEVLWLPDEDEENLVLHRIHEKYAPGSTEAYVPVTNLLDEIDLDSLSGPRIAPWGQNDLMQLLTRQAEVQGISLRACAERFTTAKLIDSTQGWHFHPVLGFGRKH